MKSIIKKIIDIDNKVIDFIDQKLKNKYLDKIMVIFTTLGEGGGIWILFSIPLLYSHKYHNVGIVIVLSLMISFILGELLIKPLVKRKRPFIHMKNTKVLIKKPKSYSLPSGHALTSFLSSFILSYYFPQYMILFIGIATLIAFSRIYLYVHYLSDVVLSLFISILFSFLIISLLN